MGPFQSATEELLADEARLDTALVALLRLARSIQQIPDAESEARELLMQGLEVQTLTRK